MALAFLLAGLPGSAAAQLFKICGDVDDNDTVTVTDGVQVLRAAAGLPSDCTDAICDVDVNGTIGVTDGVIVLRKAAGLAITEDCIPDEGSINQQVAHLIQRAAQPFVSEALGTIVLHRDESVDGTSFECDNGEDGTYDISFSDGEQDASFSTCDIGNIEIDGSADNSNDDPILSLDISDVRTEESATFDSDGLLGVNVEGGVKYSGRVEVSPSFERFDTGDFTMFVTNLAATANGKPLGGSVQIELTEDSNVPDVKRIQIFYDGSNLARVLVTFTDGSFKNYKFELQFRNFI